MSKYHILTGLMTAAAIAISGTPAFAQGARDVVIVLEEAPQVVEPCESALYGVGLIIKQNITETLTELDPSSGKPIPRLATSWERINDTTWRFKLREGVVFHDGAPFNAEAVSHSLTRLMNAKLNCMTRNKFFTPGTFTATPVDEHTIDITTDPAQQILPSLLTTLVIVSPNTPMDEVSSKPIGTGPYVFDSWTQGERVTLTRFDKYWGEKPAIEKATFIVRNESAVRAAMVATGEADIAPSIAVQDAVDPAIDFSYPNSETTRIRIGQDKAPLNDIRIRKALNLATDRNAFIGTILSKDVVPASQLVVPTTLGYNKDLTPWPYDLEQAKALIDEARAAGVAVDTPIRLIGRQNLFPNITEVLQALVQMWQAAGLNVELTMVERSQALELGTKPYAADRPPTMITDQHNNDMGDASFTVVYKYSSSGPQADTSDPNLDKLISEAAMANDDKRGALFKEAFRVISEDIVPDVMLFHMAGYARVSSKLDFRPTIATNSELQLGKIKFTQ